MKPLAIAEIDLRRALRQPTTIVLYMFLPLVLILILGAAFGGSGKPRAGVVTAGKGPLAEALRNAIGAADGLTVTTVDSEPALVRAVEHGELDAGLVISQTYDSAVTGDGTVALHYVARSDLTGQRIGAILTAIVDQQSARLRAARFTAHEQGVPFDAALDRVTAVESHVPQATIEASTVGTASRSNSEGRFDASAYTQLLLFMFMMAMTGSVAMLETRRLGITRRMVATPTTAWAIVGGEALGQLAITVTQGIIVMLASGLMFGVHWGDPLAATALMVAFSLVATGAGMLLGVAATSERTATPLAVLLSLGLAALGGTMMPLEFFSPTMRTVAHVLTPHAWAVDGFTTLIRHNGNIVDIAGPLGVLLAAALVLLSVASALMRRAVTR